MKALAASLQEELLQLIRTICVIPAPSHQEERRAAFVQQWCTQMGLQAHIDRAKNVVIPVRVADNGPVTVIMAHTDVVFPDLEPLPLQEDAEKLYCPGVGDDTASLAVLLLCARWAQQQTTGGGLLFVANACEEGLGNLKGIRTIMEDYGSRVQGMITFDGGLGDIVSEAVGSARYRIAVRTRGGHSFGAFGAPNAIERLSDLIGRLYTQPLPNMPGARTTYNVGLISGGTSVNTIAQYAEMLYEYRSTRRECLATMEENLQTALRHSREAGDDVTVELLGLRPCRGDVPAAAQDALEGALQRAMDRTGIPSRRRPGSNDANWPLSLGVPAAGTGVYSGGGSHTREEWVLKASLLPGMEFALYLVQDLLG